MFPMIPMIVHIIGIKFVDLRDIYLLLRDKVTRLQVARFSQQQNI